MRRSSGPRLPRRPAADRSTILHQLGLTGVYPKWRSAPGQARAGHARGRSVRQLKFLSAKTGHSDVLRRLGPGRIIANRDRAPPSPQWHQTARRRSPHRLLQAIAVLRRSPCDTRAVWSSRAWKRLSDPPVAALAAGHAAGRPNFERAADRARLVAEGQADARTPIDRRTRELSGQSACSRSADATSRPLRERLGCQGPRKHVPAKMPSTSVAASAAICAHRGERSACLTAPALASRKIDNHCRHDRLSGGR